MSILRRPHIGPHAGIRTPNGAFTGGAAPGGFTPATMAGIQGWYDFSTLGLADGTAIASISDGSPNGRTASQATSTTRPLAKTGANGINGLSVALFDGVDDVLLTAAFAVVQPITVYAVINNGGGRYWSGGDLGIRTGWDLSTEANNFAGSAFLASDTDLNPKVVTSVFNGASSLIRANAVQIGTGSPGAAGVVSGIALGAAVSAQFWSAKLGELFWTNTATVDTAAESYLRTKWGTP